MEKRPLNALLLPRYFGLLLSAVWVRGNNYGERQLTFVEKGIWMRCELELLGRV